MELPFHMPFRYNRYASRYGYASYGNEYGYGYGYGDSDRYKEQDGAQS